LSGVITHIQRYSIHDGPGIRTVVFLKGCPLRCMWCSNPETQSFQLEVEFIASLCAHCGICLRVCQLEAINPDIDCPEGLKINRTLCTVCGDCVEQCPNEALRMVGEETSVDEVMKEVLKDNAYYRRSGGGVTLSGGEPLSQADFAEALLRACHQHNIHTAIETCGAVPRKSLEKVLPMTDLFLYDIKHMDDCQHTHLTGFSNREILSNLRWLSAQGKEIILRVPFVPGLNSDGATLLSIANLAGDLNISEVHLMPFHQMGRDKYRHLGRTYSLREEADAHLSADGRQALAAAKRLLEDCNLRVLIGG